MTDIALLEERNATKSENRNSFDSVHPTLPPPGSIVSALRSLNAQPQRNTPVLLQCLCISDRKACPALNEVLRAFEYTRRCTSLIFFRPTAPCLYIFWKDPPTTSAVRANSKVLVSWVSVFCRFTTAAGVATGGQFRSSLSAFGTCGLWQAMVQNRVRHSTRHRQAPTAPRRCVPYTPPPPSAHALPPLLSFSCQHPSQLQTTAFFKIKHALHLLAHFHRPHLHLKNKSFRECPTSPFEIIPRYLNPPDIDKATAV